MKNQDHLVREAEARAYAHYDMSSVDRTVTVESSLGPVDVRVCVFGEPTDETPVVLLHGIASVTVIAASLLPYLRGRQVYAVDWPGHGLSGASVLPRGTRFRTQAVAVLRSLLDALGLDRVDLVGHSMGAQISLYSALDLGPRVRRLALLGAPGAGLPGVRPITAMKLAAIPGLGPALLAAPMSERVFIRGNEVALGKGVLDDVPADVLRAAHLLAGRRSNARSIASFFRTLLKRGKVRPGIALDATELARITQDPRRRTRTVAGGSRHRRHCDRHPPRHRRGSRTTPSPRIARNAALSILPTAFLGMASSTTSDVGRL